MLKKIKAKKEEVTPTQTVHPEAEMTYEEQVEHLQNQGKAIYEILLYLKRIAETLDSLKEIAEEQDEE